MKITILTYGSSGDVLPYMALGLGLKDSGHRVTLCAPVSFENTIKNTGLGYHPLHSDMQKIAYTEQGEKWMAAKNTREFNKALANIYYNERVALHQDTYDACKDADAIIAGSLMVYYAAMLSERFQLPFITANVNPVSVMSGDFPHFVVRPKPFYFSILNKATHVLMGHRYEKHMKPIMNPWRIEMGLPELKGSVFLKMLELKVPTLLGYSPLLLPRSAAWKEHVAVSGEWKLPAKYKKTISIDAALEEWLQAGPAPIYFGFGSMPVRDPQALIEMVTAICAETGARAIINAGWSQIGPIENSMSSSIYTLKYGDLEWLFPQCSSLVIHGGVGTVHISIRAGIPPVICSFFADNAFWGERLTKMGVSRHIPYKQVTKEWLTEAIADLKAEQPRAIALELSNKIKAENGLQTAVEFINTRLPTALPYSDWKGKQKKAIDSLQTPVVSRQQVEPPQIPNTEI
jgi:sterol 3beta-glucosyltransferase